MASMAPSQNTATDTRTCLDIFASTGGFSAAFADSPNWTVTTVDNREETNPDILADVYSLEPSDLPPSDVILAGHPCTVLSTAGNHDQWNHAEKEPIGDMAQKHVAMVYHTLGLIHALSPDYWFLENPRGRLRWILGEPTGTVSYCQYGTDYMKPTDLWGEHPPELVYEMCSPGDECHSRNKNDDGSNDVVSTMGGDYNERSSVPRELSDAILSAVEAGDTAATRQTTLVDS